MPFDRRGSPKPAQCQDKATTGPTGKHSKTTIVKYFVREGSGKGFLLAGFITQAKICQDWRNDKREYFRIQDVFTQLQNIFFFIGSFNNI